MYIFVENRTLVAFDLCLGPFSKALRKNGSPMVDPWLTTDFKQAQAPGMAILVYIHPWILVQYIPLNPTFKWCGVNLVILVIVIVGYEISYSHIMLYLTIVHNHIYITYITYKMGPPR